MKLKERINECWRSNTQNRVTLLGNVSILAGVAEGLYYFGEHSNFSIGLTVGFFTTGLLALYSTIFGRETPESYDLTLEHIKHNKSITPDWIKPKLETYCVRQGVYLACRDTGNLSVFNEANRGNGGIPNF